MTSDESARNTHPDTAYGPEHTPRLRWAKHAPDVYKAMVGLDAAAREGVDPA